MGERHSSIREGLKEDWGTSWGEPEVNQTSIRNFDYWQSCREEYQGNARGILKEHQITGVSEEHSRSIDGVLDIRKVLQDFGRSITEVLNKF